MSPLVPVEELRAMAPTLSEKSTYRLAQRLGTVRAGRRVFVRRVDVERWIATGDDSGTKAPKRKRRAA